MESCHCICNACRYDSEDFVCCFIHVLWSVNSRNKNNDNDDDNNEECRDEVKMKMIWRRKVNYYDMLE